MTAAERLRDMARVLGDTEWGASLADELREIADGAEREARRGENPNGKLRRQRMQAHVMAVQRICAERKRRIKELNVRLAEVRAEAAGYARMLGICADGTPARRLDEVWTVDGDGPYHVDCNWADGTASLVEVAGHVACRTLTHERPGSRTEADRARADDGEGMPGHGGDVLAWVEGHGGLSQVEDVYNDLRAVVERLGIEWSESELHGLMDALDRRLMPEGMEWPRTDMGESVKLGDRLIDDDPLEGWREVDTIIFQRTEGGYTVEIENDRGVSQLYEPGERVKRPDFQKSKEIDAPLTSYSDENPAPKVLDADGAETHAGDTVWDIDSGVKWTVIAVDGTDRVRLQAADSDAWMMDLHPSKITHRAPVLAADGKPLREGETVWTKDGCEWTVADTDVALMPGCVQVRWSGKMSYANPLQLTHERPETRQSIADEIGEEMAKRIDAIVNAGRWN